ncbi:hypothetical protein NKG94_45500 [Micromonospora sp. M12]
MIAYAMHGDERTGWWTDLRLLLPAEGAEQRPIGWRIAADDGPRTPTGQARVIAPPDAARVTVTVEGAPRHCHPRRVERRHRWNTAGQAGHPHRVRGGRSCPRNHPLPPFETDMSGLPGDSPATG